MAGLSAAGPSWPQRKSLPSTQIRCRMTACLRDRDAGTSHAAMLGHPHAPDPQARPPLAADQQRVGGLVEGCPGKLVTAPADPALHVRLAGLIAPGCQAKVRPHVPRPLETA